MPKSRYQSPERLPGATDFSTRPDLCGSINIVRLLKSQPWAWNDLRNACDLEVKYARKREEGHWELVAVAFVVSGHVDVKPWWANTTDELWEACGFPERPGAGRRPPYKRVWERLRELEQVHEEFLNAAAKIIQRCRLHDDRVFAHSHVDYTEDETHAALVHDCQADEPCRRRTETASGQPRRAMEHPLRLPRAATTEARKHRHVQNEEALEDSEKQEARDTPKVEIVERDGREVKRVKVGSCWYVTRDVEAGVRAYGRHSKTTRFWHGYYSGKLVDHFTSGVIPSVDPANRQECHLFEELFDRAKTMIGEAPQTIVGDKAFGVEGCYKRATKSNCAPVFPWRNDGSRKDKATHDRDGVKRCKHCGGPMHQVRYSENGGKPRLWFRCTFKLTRHCGDEQTIYCEEDWRALVPLSRSNALYHELQRSHSSYEGVHDYWRDRYRVASDTLANRPKIVSLGWHRLRASVACMIDWLRIAAKAEWLGSTREKKRHGGTRAFKNPGRKAADDFARERAELGLYKPWGPQAKKPGRNNATASQPQRARGSGIPPGK